MTAQTVGTQSARGVSGQVTITEVTVPLTTSVELRCESGATCIICLGGTGTLDEAGGTWLIRDGFRRLRLRPSNSNVSFLPCLLLAAS